MVLTTHTGGVYLLQAGDVTSYLDQLLTSVVGFLPNLVGAVLVLLVGWVVGRIVGRAVSEVADRAEVDRAVLKTPLGKVLGGTEKAVSGAFGAVARYFVYALAFVAATDVLAVDLLSEWVSTAMAYLPSFIAGLLVITLGFVVADFIGDSLARMRAATESRATTYFATGTKLFLYFMAVVIGLDTMGIDTAILYVFAQAAAYGAGAALAIGVGIAVGWGAKDYVSNNIAGWMGRAGSVTGGGPSDPDPRGPTMGPGTADGGVDVDSGTDDPEDDPGRDQPFGPGPRGH